MNVWKAEHQTENCCVAGCGLDRSHKTAINQPKKQLHQLPMDPLYRYTLLFFSALL